MGSVLLGIPGNWAADWYEESDPYTTKCGGLPDWSEGIVKLMASNPSTEKLLHCSLCGNHLSQVVQAYAPLPAGSGRLEERTLHVMACLQGGCGIRAQSWRVLRAQGPPATCASQEPTTSAPSQDSIPRDPQILSVTNQGIPEGSPGEEHRTAPGTARCEEDLPLTTGGFNIEQEESDVNGFQEASWATPSPSGRPGEDTWGEQEAAGGWAVGDGGWGGGDGPSLEELSAALVSATQAAARKASGQGAETEGKEKSNEVKEKVEDKRKDREEREERVEKSVAKDRGSVLPCFYVYAEAEPGRPTPSGKGKKVVGEEGVEGGGEEERDGAREGWNGEQYVYDEALSADRTFLKFKKRIERSPEQCLRYCHGGEPLWARPVMESPGPCSHCRAPKKFEMQLMPPLVYFLQESSGDDDGPQKTVGEWEWATMVVSTCSEVGVNRNENCRGGDSSPEMETEWVLLEESIVVQNEI